MRVIGGVWAGRPLTSPGGRVRPTAEPLRERWMRVIAHELTGARLLDLYAGTGALGLEALSRGAATSDFVENGPAALHALKANIAALRATKRARVFKQDALAFVRRLPADAYDLAFADPPYTSRQAELVVARWLEAPFARVLTVEHAADRKLPGPGRTLLLADSAVTVYRASSRRRTPRTR